MMKRPPKRPSPRQAGIALPVMLIILLVMLISSIYLLKSSNTTTLTASNLAYDSAQSRAVDYGLYQGYQWLAHTHRTDKALLDRSVSAAGYVARYNAGEGARTPAFWAGSRTVVLGNQRIEYVIHRMCDMAAPYNSPSNKCVQTTDNPYAAGAALPLGSSLALPTPRYNGIPRVHYLVTARMDGARGGNVMNQMVVLMGG
jgi:hypothetical protein